MPRKQKRRSPPFDLTTELAEELSLSHRGLWVAVSRGSLLEAAEDLKTLRERLAGRSATVLHVPEDGTDELLFPR